MFREWRIKEDNSSTKSVLERLLNLRGIKESKEIYEFLHPLEMEISQPDVFTDMSKATERLVKAIDNQEKIIIYGDFDADGVTSTSLLYKTFKYLGADFNYFIPNRDKEGHGFNKTALVKLLANVKPKLIISVDCGISDVEAVDFLKAFNVDVIITDHHEAGETLPNAYAIINPKAPNSLDKNLSTKQIEGLSSLAGVGVAFKVAHSLLKHYNKLEFIPELLPLVAVGTVADIVPLIQENRYFVTKGLSLIHNHYGLKRLLESAGYNIEKGVTSENIAFGVAPRINASGRLDTVSDSLKVLISDNKQEIETSIQSLNELNKVRQELSSEVFEQADTKLKKEGNKNPAIVLYDKDWHVGIIGIVASKLVEKYHKPTFLMTYSEEKKEFRCSARGIEGLSIYEIINSISDLVTGGGHQLAGGFSFITEQASFEQVKKAINENIKETLNGKELKPFIEIDLEVYPNDISIDLVEEISQMEPFGASNKSPVFAMKNLKIKQKRLMGENNDHLRITAEVNGIQFNCIRWQQGDIPLVVGDNFDLAFHPQINIYRDEVSVQLIVDDIHSELLKEEKENNEIGLKIYDHRKKTDIFSQVNDYIKKSPQNIKVFAESKSVKDNLLSYNFIYDRIFNRCNVELCDCLMFFDYPADKETFYNIIEECQPSSIHLMKYNIKAFDDTEFLTTFVKMLRYAYNNNLGKVEILRCASALGKSYEVIYSILDLFEEVNFLKINEKNEDFYRIELKEIKNLTPVLESEKFKEIKNLIMECENFQKNLLENDISTLELT